VALLGVWRTPDGRLRVEVVNERGHQSYKVLRNGFLVAQPGSIQQLAAWLAGNEHLDLGDLVED
jgi:hypothetical protein